MLDLPADIIANFLEAAECLDDDIPEYATLWEHPAAMCLRARDLIALAKAIKSGLPGEG
jgi:hypothetical protein